MAAKLVPGAACNHRHNDKVLQLALHGNAAYQKTHATMWCAVLACCCPTHGHQAHVCASQLEGRHILNFCCNQAGNVGVSSEPVGLGSSRASGLLAMGHWPPGSPLPAVGQKVGGHHITPLVRLSGA